MAYFDGAAQAGLTNKKRIEVSQNWTKMHPVMGGAPEELPHDEQ
jgi:hypothetical protein